MDTYTTPSKSDGISTPCFTKAQTRSLPSFATANATPEWPIPIRASSTRPAVNGANICAISARCLSQCRAEVCHPSSALFCSSGVILVRPKLTPVYFGGTEATILSERRSFNSRSNIGSSTEPVPKWRPVRALLRLGHDPHIWLRRLPALGIAPLCLLLGNRTRDDHVLAWFPIDRRSHLVPGG
jgi:hypothetical protein